MSAFWIGVAAVFALIFAYFAVPDEYQYRVLFWGVVGALVLRGVFVLIGAELLNRYEWMVFIFGAFLIYTGIRMALRRDSEVHPERNPVLRLVPMTRDFHGPNFFYPPPRKAHDRSSRSS